MKTIEQILRLSKNPHYKLNEAETQALLRWRETQSVGKNKKGFDKVKGGFQKHETEENIVEMEDDAKQVKENK